MFEVGSKVDGWQITSVVHTGSMAVTYAVTRPPDPRRFAMKVLFLREPSFQERLRRAGALLVGVRHPNLLPVIEVVDVDGLVAVVSPLVDGVNLTQWLAGEARGVPEVVQLFRRVCQGLRVAHEHGLVHRNLKPQKVLVDLTGRPYIHDFMLGKVVDADPDRAVTQIGTTFGTPQYMAPEQFRGASQVDPRADLFSLGCLLYEMLAGRRAFDGKGLMEIYKAVGAGPRPVLRESCPQAPDALAALVDDLLAIEPDRRPSSAREVVARLDGDPELRLLVNPSHRTATPVSALTSGREPTIERRAPLAAEPLAVVAAEPPAVVAHAPPPTDTPVSADNRPRLSSPSLITFTDGDSSESIPATVAVARLAAAAPALPAPAPPAPTSPRLGVVLVVLFIVVAGATFLIIGLAS